MGKKVPIHKLLILYHLTISIGINIPLYTLRFTLLCNPCGIFLSGNSASTEIAAFNFSLNYSKKSTVFSKYYRVVLNTAEPRIFK